jgi:hypothetical protein
MHVIINVARLPCNNVKYVKFNTNVLHEIFIHYLLLRHVSALTVGRSVLGLQAFTLLVYIYTQYSVFIHSVNTKHGTSGM